MGMDFDVVHIEGNSQRCKCEQQEDMPVLRQNRDEGRASQPEEAKHQRKHSARAGEKGENDSQKAHRFLLHHSFNLNF